MKKFVKLVFAAMLVLLAITACSPRGGYPVLPPGGGTNNGNATVSDQNDFEEAIANGEDIVLPSGKFELDADDISKPLNITGTGNSELKILINSESQNPSGDDNRGAMVLPSGSILKDIRIVFGDQNETIALSAKGNETESTDPAFAMLIQSEATLDGVTLVFPDDGSLSGINIYNTDSTVYLSDITVDGKPQRAPINITASNVSFSGTFGYADTEASCGWYGPIFAVQVNGHNGDINKASNLSFSNVNGIDMIFQEYVIDDIANFPGDILDSLVDKPSTQGQTQISGFDKNFFFMAPQNKASGDTVTYQNAGWIWLSEEMNADILPLFFTAPAHTRFFNGLSGKLTEEGDANGQFLVSDDGPTVGENTITYKVTLDAYAYNNIGAHIADVGLNIPEAATSSFNARSFGDITVVFITENTGTDGQVKATNWSISGDNVMLNYLMSMYARADFNISGTFGTASNVSDPDNGPTFTVDGGKVTLVDNTAKFYVGGATGSVTLNGTPHTNISELATDNCSGLLEYADWINELISSMMPGLGN